MNLPEYKPLEQHHPVPFDFSYEGLLKHYGAPPEGYRWLGVGDVIPEGSICADFYCGKWRLVHRVPQEVVEPTYFAIAAPIPPPATNNTSATQLTVRECVEHFRGLSQTGRSSESRRAYAECAEFLEKNCCDDV